MTDLERYEFDLNGFFIRPSILTADEIAAVTEQVRLIGTEPSALPPEHRVVPSGPSEFLLDHPRVIDVPQEVINPALRMEGAFSVYRHAGQGEQTLHSGSNGSQADPLMGYRYENGRIHAGSVRVVFELTDVEEGDGATAFVPGSHKSNLGPPGGFGAPSSELSRRFARSYSCPAGSAIFFTEALVHGGQEWRRPTPRIAILNLYSHVAINFTRFPMPPEVLAAMPKERQAWFRPVWYADFRSTPGTTRTNTIEEWVAGNESPMVYGPW